ncbi:vWA domain-containing protein [Oleiagrimonas soli]|uniref:Ca-activated chloride channel family protein n=1 Tax=Oleiagrimonas soli TaxID=1543381 RepID=A0A841KH92_9GAMM|nr:VWA domain-containing protein [Oleiagrimonas soli]MBB6183109.1 Ca-activated chloride channel family protein [Oleiagrimonas soli]
MNAKSMLYLLLTALLVVLTGCSTTRAPSATERDKTVQPQPTSPAAKMAGIVTPPPPPPVAERQADAIALAAPMPSGMQGRASMAVQPAYGWQPPATQDREHYAHYEDNPVQRVAEHPVSTFGLDVDTGSYTNVRRMIEQGQLPPGDAVRAEEFINYFDYGYAPPKNRSQPFSVTTEVAPAPWNPKRQLLLVGVQGYRVPAQDIPAANLVFLIDTSGSMMSADKLPLLKASLRQVVPKLRHRDRVALVTYAGSAGIALPSTPGDQHARILAAIDAMQPGGSTNGQAGIELAYAQARQGFIQGGVNRVILATDGDFNVGQTGIQALTDEIADKRRSGIALSTLGFGSGNYNDAMAVRLADAGNGSHHYIDSLDEGRRVLVDEMAQTLLTIAKDVKVQIEFNPARVSEYRLIGYVKRKLRREDFNNDQVDAGDIGAGANVTALYEITPAGSSAARIDPLRYAPQDRETRASSREIAWLRLRYKQPEQTRSRLIERPITDRDVHARASQRMRFAAAVAAFADALRGGKELDGYTLHDIAALARAARGDDPRGDRAGFVRLVELAEGLQTAAATPPGADSGADRTATMYR